MATEQSGSPRRADIVTAEEMQDATAWSEQAMAPHAAILIYRRQR